MKPRKPLRKSPLRSGGRIRPNRKRRDKTWAAAYGSEARVRYVKSLRCAVCGEDRDEEIVNAHLPSQSGMGKKSPYWLIVPAHAGRCHDAIDRRGNARGWLDDATRESLYHIAEQVQADWLDFTAQNHV